MSGIKDEGSKPSLLSLKPLFDQQTKSACNPDEVVSPTPAPPLASRPPLTPTFSSGPGAGDITAKQGPLNRSWEPPPRAKPGRKPMSDNPIDKRKTQNRASQRAFRERKAEQIRKAETDACDLKHTNQLLQQRCRALEESYQTLQQRAPALEKQLTEQANEIQRLRSQLAAAQQQLSSALSIPATTQSQIETSPPVLETQIGHLQQPEHPLSPPASLSVSRGCGKCDESGECPCVDEYIQILPEADQSSSIPSASSAPTPIDFTTMLPSPRKGRRPAASNTGPGSCSRCQTNPRQKMWCMGLAKQQKQRAGSLADIKSPQINPDSPTVAAAKRHDAVFVSCSKAYPILKAASGTSKVAQMGDSWLNVIMNDTESPDDSSNPSPIEVDVASALTALSRDAHDT